MSLDFVDPADHPPVLNVMLYGPPGSGKTTGALSAPGPILYVNSEGPNAAMFARRLYPDTAIREITVSGGDVLNEALLYLREPGCDIKTVVLDSLGAIFQAVLEGYTGGGKPTLPQYGDTSTALERFARALRDLSVNLVLIAHEQPVKDETSGEFERLPYTGTSNPAMGVKLMAQADVVGYTGRLEPDDEHTEPRYVAQLIPAGGRHGKDRTNELGDFPELDLSSWVDKYTRAVKPANPAKAEKETKK